MHELTNNRNELVFLQSAGLDVRVGRVVKVRKDKLGAQKQVQNELFRKKIGDKRRKS